MTASAEEIALQRYALRSQTKQPQNHFRASEKPLLFPASEVKQLSQLCVNHPPPRVPRYFITQVNYRNTGNKWKRLAFSTGHFVSKSGFLSSLRESRWSQNRCRYIISLYSGPHKPANASSSMCSRSETAPPLSRKEILLDAFLNIKSKPIHCFKLFSVPSPSVSCREVNTDNSMQLPICYLLREAHN